MPLAQFVRVTVAWMGLAATPGAAGRRALEFAGFAHAAALLLCTTQAGAWLFLREGGLRRCTQVLHDFQAVPAAPLTRLAAAVLCMLLSTCGDVAAALISGVHAGTCATGAPLLPPEWVRPTATPRRFWTQPPPPEPPTPPAALDAQPAEGAGTGDAGVAADTDAAAGEEAGRVAEGAATDGAAVGEAPGERAEPSMREGHAAEVLHRSLSSESFSANTSSLLGHSASSASLSSGDDHAEGPEVAGSPPSPSDGHRGRGSPARSVSQEPMASQSPPAGPRGGVQHVAGGSGDADADAGGPSKSEAGVNAAEVGASGHEADDDGGLTAMAMDVDGVAGAEAEADADHTADAGRQAAGEAPISSPRRADVPDALPAGLDEATPRDSTLGTAAPQSPTGDSAPMDEDSPSRANGGLPATTAGPLVGGEAAGSQTKRDREDAQAEGGPGFPSPSKRGRVDAAGAPMEDAEGDGREGPQVPPGPPPVVNGAALPAAGNTPADVAMVEAAEEAAGAAPQRNPALQRLLARCRRDAGTKEDALDTLAEDEGFWAQQQPVDVAGADALVELPLLPALLESALQQPQPRVAAALCALALARLQVREALAAFASHTETLIGEVQQGRIQFRHVDNSIIVVAEALRRLAATGDALERTAAAPPPWAEAEVAARRRLPRPPRGDACYVRCVAEHSVLRRCLQVLKLPALIVDSLVETGSVLSGAERRSLLRRLRSHFVVPLRVRPNLLAASVERVAATPGAEGQWARGPAADCCVLARTGGAGGRPRVWGTGFRACCGSLCAAG